VRSTLGNGEYVADGDADEGTAIGDLVDALTQLGAKVVATQNCPPVRIIASGLPGGKTKIAGDISSQFLSALVMVAPYAKSPVEIEVTTELSSKPYVAMTLSIMQDFGVQVERHGHERFIVQPSFFSPLPLH
jgi:3-phosphoshikimate 1-carboxyvinyltransferase